MAERSMGGEGQIDRLYWDPGGQMEIIAGVLEGRLAVLLSMDTDSLQVRGLVRQHIESYNHFIE